MPESVGLKIAESCLPFGHPSKPILATRIDQALDAKEAEVWEQCAKFLENMADEALQRSCVEDAVNEHFSRAAEIARQPNQKDLPF